MLRARGNRLSPSGEQEGAVTSNLCSAQEDFMVTLQVCSCSAVGPFESLIRAENVKMDNLFGFCLELSPFSHIFALATKNSIIFNQVNKK